MDPTPGRFEMDKFDGRGDFGMWKYKLMGQLEIQGLSEVLKDEATLYRPQVKPEDELVLDPRKVAKDIRVKNLLGSCLSDVILRKIMHEETAFGMWKELENDYQTKSLPNRIYLKQMFC
uniref:Retrovirus-related Pol polyprotein from transposon TNT 1-94 n=1 Tax=Noccaea caerulescens TaxID=107243 RepID=A0A1J3JUU5_NOCCA